MPGAEYGGEHLAVVVVASAVDMRDPALGGEGADPLLGGGASVDRPIVGDIPADHDESMSCAWRASYSIRSSAAIGSTPSSSRPSRLRWVSDRCRIRWRLVVTARSSSR
jgi:hypothetical protein